MAPDADDIREQIITAAIECIEREGVGGATIRSIAKEAGVNSAAINYYFRSKDKLLQEALYRTRREGSTKALEELDQYESEAGDLRAALRILLVHLFTGMIHYPRITQWHLSTPMATLGSGGETTEYWNGFFDDFFEKIRPLLGDASEDDLRISVMQMWSAMLLPGMMPEFFRGFTRLNLGDEEVTRRYIDRLLDHFLDPPGGAS